VPNVKVVIVVDGKAFFTTLNAAYKATQGKTGAAKLTP